jgi:TRAP-type C4-dicarboxylate transport system permease small subunit
MDTLWIAISWVARVFAWIGGAMIMVAALVVSSEVISRKLLALPISGSDEVGAYLFAVGTSWSMAFVLVTRGHVRIDALYGGFSPYVRAVFDLVALTGLAILVIALADRSWELVSDNLSGWNRSNTPLRVPLPYPQLPWFFGFVLFLAALTIAYVRAVSAFVRGDHAKVAATIGVPSQDEEVKGELEGLGIKSEQVEKKA